LDLEQSVFAFLSELALHSRPLIERVELARGFICK